MQPWRKPNLNFLKGTLIEVCRLPMALYLLNPTHIVCRYQSQSYGNHNLRAVKFGEVIFSFYKTLTTWRALAGFYFIFIRKVCKNSKVIKLYFRNHVVAFKGFCKHPSPTHRWSQYWQCFEIFQFLFNFILKCCKSTNLTKFFTSSASNISCCSATRHWKPFHNRSTWFPFWWSKDFILRKGIHRK